MRRNRLTLLVAASVGAICSLLPATATATHTPATPIHPGVQTVTGGGQCTSNFVFRDGGGTYLGQAAHCSGTGGATETDGCDSGSLPIGTTVEIEGASQPGTLVYNSWITMQAQGESDPDTCAYNDFALVRVNPADVAKVDPTVPGFGGPTGVGRLRRSPRRHRLLIRQLVAQRGRLEAEPEAGRRRPERRQRLEPDRLHPDARDPG